MKIQVTMKDPDVLYEAIRDAVYDELKSKYLEDDEIDAIADIKIDKCQDIASKWFTYGEYLSVEIDTETSAIRVLEANE